jgi:hypothetical protein
MKKEVVNGKKEDDEISGFSVCFCVLVVIRESVCASERLIDLCTHRRAGKG